MPQQLTRLIIVFGLLVAILIAARHFLIPKTFGEIGHYRAAAVESIRATNIKYAGRQACADCHDDVVRLHDSSRHRNVACEVCHGPAAAHVEAPMDVRLRVPNQRGQCPLCHGYDPSRPTGFPQIDPVAHNPLKACITCHSPHAPETPRAPQDCGACHGQIARSKAVSHHALLECTQCHQTSKEHLITPQASRPSKPTVRAFCGQCHSPEATAPREIARVDMSTHGARYVCWQCHYPHFPELR